MKPQLTPPEIASLILSGEIQTAISSASVTKPRKSRRLPVEMEGGLRKSGAKRVPVQVTDLSVDGFRVGAQFNLWPGTDVWLSLPGLEPRHAIVAWALGDAAGLSFEQPLHPTVLDMIVRRSRATNAT